MVLLRRSLRNFDLTQLSGDLSLNCCEGLQINTVGNRIKVIDRLECSESCKLLERNKFTLSEEKGERC